MDNKIFNVNGRTKEELLIALTLVLLQEGVKQFEGYFVDPKKGLAFTRYDHKNKFLVPINAQTASDMIWDWLKTPEAKSIPHSGKDWDHDLDHDGGNVVGWRVFCDDWGHVGSSQSAFICVKPAFLWMGK